MAAAGSAIGLGNVWRFPYITGKHGGGAFVLIYIAALFVIVLPLMIAEIAMGRCAQADAAGTFEKLGSNRWKIVGMLAILSSFVIVSYYPVIAGWTLAYLLNSFTGLAEAAALGKSSEFFAALLSDPIRVLSFQFAVMVICSVVIYKGIASGIEKMCKFLMPILFVVMILLVIRSLMLPGAVEGLSFFLRPDFSRVGYDGVLAAIGQGFFSASVAAGVMITYGSYLNENEYIPKTAGMILALDTFVAIMSGLIIFPATFTFGADAGSGPGLTFITLPDVFAMMPHGRFFSFAFFALLFIVAITSIFSMLEVAVSYTMDHFKWSRPKSAVIVGIAASLLGIPSALSVGGRFPLIFGTDFLSAVDLLINNAALPIGGFFTAIFAGWCWIGAKDEITNCGKNKFPAYTMWLWLCRTVVPVFIGTVFVKGMMN